MLRQKPTQADTDKVNCNSCEKQFNRNHYSQNEVSKCNSGEKTVGHNIIQNYLEINDTDKDFVPNMISISNPVDPSSRILNMIFKKLLIWQDIKNRFNYNYKSSF